VGGDLDQADPRAVAEAVADLHGTLGARVLVVHAASWALAHGPGAPSMGAALDTAITLAATRYRVGDRLSRADLDLTARTTPPDEARRFAAEVVRRLGHDAVCRPVPAFDVPLPTTIGLGDTFAGGLALGLLTALG
jgi:ADP-dependent phosphofructokinase/glucokinase